MKKLFVSMLILFNCVTLFAQGIGNWEKPDPEKENTCQDYKNQIYELQKDFVKYAGKVNEDYKDLEFSSVVKEMVIHHSSQTKAINSIDKSLAVKESIEDGKLHINELKADQCQCQDEYEAMAQTVLKLKDIYSKYYQLCKHKSSTDKVEANTELDSIDKELERRVHELEHGQEHKIQEESGKSEDQKQ